MNRLRPHSLPAPAMNYRITVAEAASPATRMRFPRRRQANARGDGVVEPCSRTPMTAALLAGAVPRSMPSTPVPPDSGGDMHDLLSQVMRWRDTSPATKEGP